MLIIFPQLYANVLVSYEALNFIFHVQLLICQQMHWFFPYFDYCSPVWSNCNLKFSSILQILQNKFAHFFFLLILGLQLITCCAILTGPNWTKDGNSNLFRLYLSVSKMMLPIIFCLNLFLLPQFIPKIYAVKLQIRLLCFKNQTWEAHFSLQRKLYME